MKKVVLFLIIVGLLTAGILYSRRSSTISVPQTAPNFAEDLDGSDPTPLPQTVGE